jgi:hypothetical protein
VLDSVSLMDNRGCFHAASVLTTFLIGSFAARAKESPRYFKDSEGASPQQSPQCCRKRRFAGVLRVYVFEKFGSSGRIRTYNPSVNSRMLYR